MTIKIEYITGVIMNFIDAQQMQKDHPDTFEAPTDAELEKLKIGDIVKVCHNDERFWVVIINIEGDKITANVDNELICNQPFNNGDNIEFEKKHIYNIY